MKFKWLIVSLFIPLLSLSQSSRIDSLKIQLPSLRDSNRIDCLNKLSVEYYINALNQTYINVQTDSAISFASQAYYEGIKINYTRGIAESLQNLGEISRDRDEFSIAENYFRRSIPLFEKIHDRERYNWAHVTLGWSLYVQCKFSEAKLMYEQALPFYITVDNKEKQSMLLRLISYIDKDRGYSEKAFENMLQAIRITYKISDVRGVISSPENMGWLYNEAGDRETGLSYFRLAAKNAKPINPVRYNNTMATIARLNNQFDSAIYYYQQSYNCVMLKTTDTAIRKRTLAYRGSDLGEIYLTQLKYDSAIVQFKSALEFYEKANNKKGVIRILGALARCYQSKGKPGTSFLYAKRLFEIAQETGARLFLRDAYQLYWQVNSQQGNTDSAYKYNLKYTAIKDSILSDEYRRNLAVSEMKWQDEKQKTTINLLQKSQQLTQEKLSLQQQKIKSESFIRYTLIATSIAFLLIAIFIIRTINLKRKNEKQQLEYALALQQLETKKATVEFQQQATELEMQALRAQMNPHFIFNCLSSINRFILINKTEEASDYLTKFSRLIRMALHNSEKPLITLETELEALRLYLDLERLRFKNAFNYSITFINTIDINTLYIPPMLIQPFTENAIWHGLMHKKGIGCLEIQLCAADKILTCIIIDNGIGRNMAASFNSRTAEKNKSMGMNITAGRLALLNKSKNEAALFTIEDLIDEEGNGCGTKVILTIPYKDLTEVVV